MNNNRALIIVTSQRQMAPGKTTGFWLSELIHPVYEFERAGIKVDISCRDGGAPPIDENSRDLGDPINRDFMEKKTFQYRLQNTLRLSEVNASDYGAVVLAGGYGALWDFPVNRELSSLVQRVFEEGGFVGAIGEGVAGLLGVRLDSGAMLVQDLKMTAISDSELRASGISEKLQLFPETELRRLGAMVMVRPNWQKHFVIDGRLVTGQNASSAQAVGETLTHFLLRAGARARSAP